MNIYDFYGEISFFLFDYVDVRLYFLQGKDIYIIGGKERKCIHRSKGNVLTPSPHIFLFMY